MFFASLDVVLILLLAAPWVLLWLVRTYIRRNRARFFPELRALEATESERVWRAASRDRQARAWTTALAACFVLTYVFGRSALCLICGARTQIAADRVQVILFAALVGFFPLVRCIALRSRTMAAIRFHMNQRGLRICVACGYDLRGTTSSECPECGFTHRASLCAECLGQGRISRMPYLMVGLACITSWGTWALMLHLISGGWSAWEDRVLVVVLISSLVFLLGVGFLMHYISGPRFGACRACDGKGVQRSQVTCEAL